LIVNRSGARYTLNGFSIAWQKLMTKAMKDKVLEQRFTFHDLRAKAGSESENAQDLPGHDDPRTTKNAFVSCFGA
jgi:integrase